MNPELLNLFSNVLNFVILLYIAINLLGTPCFSTFQLSLTAFGLFASITTQIISVILRKY